MFLAKPAGPPLARPVGVVAAAALHAALVVALLQQETVRPAPIQPAAPLMVNIIAPSKPALEPAQPAAPVQPEAAKPKPAKPVPPKPAPGKPKTQPRRAAAPVAKRQPLIAAPSAAPSPVFAPPAAAEPPAQPAAPPAPPTAAPAPAPVTPPRFNASYLDNPAPEYPPQSRSEGEQGRVILRVFVNAQGGAERVEIRKSSGFDRLDEAARATVRRWRFVPARQGGEPVSAWVNVPISFSLEG